MFRWDSIAQLHPKTSQLISLVLSWPTLNRTDSIMIHGDIQRRIGTIFLCTTCYIFHLCKFNKITIYFTKVVLQHNKTCVDMWSLKPFTIIYHIAGKKLLEEISISRKHSRCGFCWLYIISNICFSNFIKYIKVYYNTYTISGGDIFRQILPKLPSLQYHKTCVIKISFIFLFYLCISENIIW